MKPERLEMGNLFSLGVGLLCREQDEFQGFIIFEKESDTQFNTVTFSNDQEKADFLRVMHDMASRMQPETSFVLMNSWLASVDQKKYKPGMRASKQDNKEECLVLIRQDKHECELWKAPILRTESGTIKGVGDRVKDTMKAFQGEFCFIKPGIH